MRVKAIQAVYVMVFLAVAPVGANALVLKCSFDVPGKGWSLAMSIAVQDDGERFTVALVEPETGRFKHFMPTKGLAIPSRVQRGFIEYTWGLDGQTKTSKQEIVVTDVGDKTINSFKAYYFDAHGTPVTIWVHTWQAGNPAHLHNFDQLPPKMISGSCE